MKKILFVSTTLGNGGAERIISYLLNEFAKDQNKQIILLLLKRKETLISVMFLLT